MTKNRLEPEQLSNAQRLRRDMSIPERVLWKDLRDRGLAGLKFRRQHPLGPYLADFYCDEASLVVEIDSSFHLGRVEEDRRRTAWIEQQGIAVIRTSASEISSDIHMVLDWTRRNAESRLPLPPGEGRSSEARTG
jgi:very-short-patch-repair endonuclease